MNLRIDGTCPVNACSASSPAGVDAAISDMIDEVYASGAVVTSSSLTFSPGSGPIPVPGFTCQMVITPNGQEVAIATAATNCVAELLANGGHVATWSQS